MIPFGGILPGEVVLPEKAAHWLYHNTGTQFAPWPDGIRWSTQGIEGPDCQFDILVFQPNDASPETHEMVRQALEHALNESA